MANGAMLPAGTTESRKRASNWRNDVRIASIEAMGDRPPSLNCIRMMVEFRLPYPKSSVRKYQLGWLPHIKQPDVDKLLRMILDAMTGIVWGDDSQVAFATINKTYAWDNRTGAYVIIDFMSDESMRELALAAREVTDVIESL